MSSHGFFCMDFSYDIWGCKGACLKKDTEIASFWWPIPRYYRASFSPFTLGHTSHKPPPSFKRRKQRRHLLIKIVSIPLKQGLKNVQKYICCTHTHMHTCACIPAVLLTTGMSCEVALDAELVNTAPLLLGEIQNYFPSSLSSHIFIKWLIHNLGLHVFLFKDTSFNIYSWFTVIKLMPTELQCMPEWNFSKKCFPSKVHHGPSSLEALESMSVYLGLI